MTKKVYSVEEIKRIVTPIAVRHGLRQVYLFGSYAKGTATGASDIDLCVDAANLPGMFALGGFYAALQEALKKDLDLITLKALQTTPDASFRANLEKERILIYERE